MELHIGHWRGDRPALRAATPTQRGLRTKNAPLPLTSNPPLLRRGRKGAYPRLLVTSLSALPLLARKRRFSGFLGSIYFTSRRPKNYTKTRRCGEMRFSIILNPPALPRLSHALSTTHRESGEESGLAAVAPKGNSNNTATGHTRAPAWFWILERVL